MAQHPACRRNPFRMFTAVESALGKFLPKNAAATLSGRVRVLLTRVCWRPPWVTGEYVDQFESFDDVFHTLRASCHVPGLNLFPYGVRKGGEVRRYFDGLMWSSLLVPWQCDRTASSSRSPRRASP